MILSTCRGLTEILASAGPAALARGDGGFGVPVPFTGRTTAQLRLHPEPSADLTAEAEEVAQLLAAHLRVGLDRIASVEHLRHAAESRQRIGQAVGMLVERRRVTPEAAFAELVRQSQARNVKLREVARAVVETGLEPDQITVP